MHEQSARLRSSLIAVCLALAAVAVAALAAAALGAGTRELPEPPAAPTTLKVMEFNIEYGGTHVSFAKVVEAVRKADPDVIGLEEAETNSGRLARAAGYPYWSDSMQVVSRYPLLEPPQAERGLPVRARGAGPLRGARQRPPAVRALRAQPHPRRQDGGPGGGRRGEGAAALHPDAAPAAPASGAAGRPGVPARRLQRAVAPRLHGGGRRHAPQRQVRGRLAGERGRGGRRLHRLVAGGAPRPGRQPRPHVVGGAPQGERLEPDGEGSQGPHRLHLRGRAGDGHGLSACRREERP